MKILIVVPDTEMGGITSSAVNLNNELISRGHEVYFLDLSGEFLVGERCKRETRRIELYGRSRYWSLQFSDVKKSKGIRKIKFLILGLLKKITNRLGLWNALIFKKFSKYGKFDIAIAFRQCSPCYHFVLRKVSAKRKIGFVHGELKFMNNIHSWQRYMIKFDTMAYVSNAVKNEFIKTFPELSQNSCTIYNMFDKQRIIDLSKRKNHLSFNKDIKNIVTIARIDNDFKRINLIPIICKQMLEKTETKFHWYIIGDGPNLRENQELIKEMGVEDVLTLCGSIENPYSALKEADFSVLISKSEAYPMCVIESFILQVPVVTTKFPSVYEMMENGKQGLITDFSVEDITRKIITMIDNNKVYSSCKENLMEVDYSNELAYSQFMAAGKV